MMPAYKGLTEQATVREVLKDLDAGDVFWDEPLDKHTSMGVGGAADALVYPKDIDGLRQIVSVLSNRGIPYFPVGNWTNLIVGDAGFRGVIIALKALKAIRMLTEKETDVPEIYAEAGLSLAEFVDFAARSSLAGMEFCAGIPGSVGGAVRMNAGAFGHEMKDIVRNVSVIHRDGSVVDIRREALLFSYRDLELPDGSVLAAATFHLTKGSERDVRRKIREIMDQRKAKHPLADRSAGSVFKNPREIPAGRIIEELGLKGTAVGGAQISEKHGNFIVNKGNAKARDILTLINLVQERVFRERGIKLELEVKIIGEMS
jgi:UDP-N-acetylmuramate dehydrogenase